MVLSQTAFVVRYFNNKFKQLRMRKMRKFKQKKLINNKLIIIKFIIIYFISPEYGNLKNKFNDKFYNIILIKKISKYNPNLIIKI